MLKENRFLVVLLTLAVIINAGIFTVNAAETKASEIQFLKENDAKIRVGYVTTRVASTTPEGLTVTYSSSDTSIAIVNQNGKVKGLKPGNVTITAKTGGLKTSYRANVIAGSPIGNASPLTGGTLEEKINAMTLEPLVADSFTDIYKIIDKATKKDMTNYQKLRTAYNCTAKYISDTFGPYGTSCFDSSFMMKDMLEYVGLRAVQIGGATKSASGGWTGHIWVGTIIDGEIYYFDADLPKYGVSPNKCFGVTAKTTSIYKDGEVFNEWDDDLRAEYYRKP